MWVTALANKRSHYTSQHREEERQRRERDKRSTLGHSTICRCTSLTSHYTENPLPSAITLLQTPPPIFYLKFSLWIVLPLNTGKQASAILSLMYRMMLSHTTLEVNSMHFTPLSLWATTSNVIHLPWTFRKTHPLTVKKEKIHIRWTECSLPVR